jgi:hypothetical protein
MAGVWKFIITSQGKISSLDNCDYPHWDQLPRTLFVPDPKERIGSIDKSFSDILQFRKLEVSEIIIWRSHLDLIDLERKRLNQNQTMLRKTMTSTPVRDEAIKLFIDQHTALHSSTIAQTGIWSFEDAVLDNIKEEKFRLIPKNSEHSIAWCIWHIASIEDITMNYLIASSPQVFTIGNWQERLKVPYRDSGNEMGQGEINYLSHQIDIEELREYRAAVGRRTQEIVNQLQPEMLGELVNPSRIKQIKDDGTVIPAAFGITDYWNRRNIAGLLLMPATRHNLVHLNEALNLKRKK